MKQGKISPGKILLQWLPAVTILIFVLIGLHYRHDFSLENLLSRTPEQGIAAVGFLLLLFALKSLSIVFPILVLYALSGILFSPLAAVLVNLAGTAVTLLLPYGLGRLSGNSLVGSILQKYPKAAQLQEFQLENIWFFSFFLRVLGLLPGDVVSLYQGASKFPLAPCLFGGILGMFPALLAGTFMGDNITRPGSPEFLLSVGAMVVISLLSMLLYRKFKRKNRKPKK